MKMNHKNDAREQKQGMTLAEVMVAVTVFSLLMGGFMQFFTNTYQMSFISNQKMLINADMRKITNEMTYEARDAAYGLVYKSFFPQAGGDFRNPASGLQASDYILRDEETGDLLVLVYYGLDPNPADTIRPPIKRVVGYYRSIENTQQNIGPVRKFDFMVPDIYQNYPIEKLIPPATSFPEHRVVLEFSRGLADERLFFNYLDKGIMVNGQIFHGNAYKRVTDTYNFTITPRGPTGNEDYP